MDGKANEAVTLWRRKACLRCGWVWKTRLRREPRVCPRCKSYQYGERREEKP